MDEDWLDPPNPLVPAGSHADPISAQNWERITTKYADVGYREGISEGKLSALQEGFDGSFTQAVPLVRRLGNLRGRVAGLLAFALAQKGEGENGQEEEMIVKIRELNADLGRLNMGDILPVDQEALDHAKEHLGDGNEDLPREEKEMDELMSAFDGAKVVGQGGEAVGRQAREGELLDLMECRLEEITKMAGLI